MLFRFVGWILQVALLVTLTIVFRVLPTAFFVLLWSIAFTIRLLIGICQPWLEERQRRRERWAELFGEQEYRYRRRIVEAWSINERTRARF